MKCLGLRQKSHNIRLYFKRKAEALPYSFLLVRELEFPNHYHNLIYSPWVNLKG